MFKLAIEVCFENHFGLIHAIFLSLGSTKSGYFFLGHPLLLKYICKNIACFRSINTGCPRKKVRDLITTSAKNLA